MMKPIIILLLLTMSTGNLQAQFGTKFKKALKSKRNKNEEFEKVPDQGITSALHAKYVGQIVWANSEIMVGSEDEGQFKKSFKPSEYIYGRIYLPHGTNNEPLYWGDDEKVKPCTSSCSYNYRIYIDNVKTNLYFGANTYDEEIKATTFSIALNPSPGKGEVKRSWKNAIDELPVGNHTIKFEFYVHKNGEQESKIMAVSEFEMVKNSIDSETVYGKSFNDFKKEMDNPELEKELLGALQNEVDKYESYDQKYSEVKITWKKWKTARHEYTGVIIGRDINAYCFATWPNGECTVEIYSFRQDFDGTSYDKGGAYSLGKGEKEYVDCH